MLVKELTEENFASGYKDESAKDMRLTIRSWVDVVFGGREDVMAFCRSRIMGVLGEEPNGFEEMSTDDLTESLSSQQLRMIWMDAVDFALQVEAE